MKFLRVWTFFLFCLVGVLFFYEMKRDGFLSFEKNTSDYEVTAPVLREESESIAVLKELAEKDRAYQVIYEHYEQYPENLISALVNNPEMLDFAKGYLGHKDNVTGGLTHGEKQQKYPLFLQWDKRWGYASYGESCIGLSGCGPTCLSMVAYALKQDSSFTPDQVATYAEQNGFYVEGTGTAWSLMTEGANAYGLSSTELSFGEQVMQEELEQGNLIICAMGAGDFTTAGHFIVLYGYDENGFFVNDPNSLARSEKQWTFEELDGQVRNLWSYEIL